ncbi:zinc finger MYND-type containing 10 [Oratosquilla oratoria]|uniref:zinc finger MYND-type containing 10 n=1 Tax=Oratosquilla oratoria TaxID=337810 RepID=UPI003F75DD24
MASELKDALDGFTVEEYVKKLDCVPLEQLGSKRWSEQACRLVQLSIQAVVEARREGEEHVQHCITMDSKGSVLVWELLTCEAFRTEIVPRLFHQSKRKAKPCSTPVGKSSSTSSTQPSSSSAQGPSSSFSSISSSSPSSSSLSNSSYFSASSSLSAALTPTSSSNTSSSSCEPSSSLSSSSGSSVSLASFTDPNVSFSFPSPSSLSSSISFTSTSSLEKSELLVSSLSSHSSSASPPKKAESSGKETRETKELLGECRSGGERGGAARKMATSETSRSLVELKEKEENGMEVEDVQQILPTSSLPSSIVLQAEAALTGLLECLTFHQDSSVALEGVALDLVDYCVRQLTSIASHAYVRHGQPIYSPEEAKSESLSLKKTFSASETQLALEEISKESRRVQMVVAARSVGLLQNLCSHLKHLPLCTSTRLLQVHDVPLLLATLLLETPWMADHKGKSYRFSEGEWWEEGDEDDSPSLSKLDAQMWLTLHTLLLHPETANSYELNSVRRSQLLKLQKLLTEELLSEMAPLEAMARFLGQLAFMAPQTGRSPPLVTTVAQIGDAPTRQWSPRWPALLQHLAPTLLMPSHSVLRSLAMLMAGAWDLDTLEALLPESPTCGLCGQPAGRRCSRCRCQWYCRRECQVKHWKTHKAFCDVIANEK